MSIDEKIAQLHGFRDKDHYRVVPGLERLGIPELHVTNGPAGVGPGGAGSQKPATALPAPIALAASWDPELARLYGRVAAEETRALDSNLLESPDINIARVPQGGRVFESYGEDPWLISRLTVANIEGIQSTGMIANVKHYLANNQETDRGTINEIIAERPLREIYMPAFEAAVKEAHVASLMCAYPRVNGDFNCENRPLLTDVLKREWGFDGFVTSDFGAVHSTVPSALAGLDLELPTGIYFGDELRKAVDAGKVPVATIDEMLMRRFAKMMELGWFGRQPAPKPIPVLANGAISRAIATQSMVLLKNDGQLLPLDRDRIKKIALIGPYAVRQMTGGGGSSHVIPLYSVAPVDGLDYALLSQTKILLLDGNDIDEAVNAAKSADVAILMVGDDEGEDHDHGIDLPERQNRLIAAVAAANPKTVVVLKSGSAVIMPWVDQVPAILEAWYPGEEDGNAVADILMGKVNPSGKLPLTFPRATSDTLAATPDRFPGNGTTVHYSEGLEVGYRAFQAHKVEPLFPFGFGLSYTQFQFSNLKAIPGPNHTASVSFTVTNNGVRAGADVAQLYLTYPSIPEGNEPPRQLRGFQKLTLKPHESQTVRLTLNARSFSFWSDAAHAWQVPAGAFHIFVGNSSVDTPLETNLVLP
ncbi:beta-glucosidase [Granulicella rosea]|uniref:Beta-glucosidase n=1 Tax=Granulicella rosea TaxID=474952 RepID=A0A239LY77_9BACT|nr:glycoside hydrolase family 3 C-terminal domain-containing protein [Granulicella rosea]SNT35617.1 beta-glucosidase [Granulicella rosea]